MIGTFQVSRALFVVLSKSYDPSNAGNGAERCRLQHKMRSDMYDSIAAGGRSLGFCDRIPHSASGERFAIFRFPPSTRPGAIAGPFFSAADDI